MIRALKIFALILSLVCSVNSCYSQDLVAGEISVRSLSVKTYSATVLFQYKSTLFTPRPKILINYGDKIDTLYYSGSGGICSSSSLTTVIYSGTHTYSSYGNYNISCTDTFRIANIQNITNSSTEKLSLQHQLSVSSFWGGNNSSSSTKCLTDQWNCCNWAYNPGSVDFDGDSLHYSLVPPFTSNYSFPSASVDVYGTMTFSPTAIGLYAFCMRIDEWRSLGTNKYLIGSTFREMMINVTSLVGIKENALLQNQISIYPNPVSNTLYISTEQNEFENSEIEITNCLGQTVLKLQYNKEIDLSSLAEGCYVLKIITSDKQQFYSKFIKE